MAGINTSAISAQFSFGGSGANDQYIVFALGEEHYAIPILSVQSIIGYAAPSPVPNTPPYMKGIVNLRGDVIPIIDMRMRFNFPERAYDDSTVVVIIEIAQKKYGLVVDEVSDVVAIPNENLQTDFDLQTGIQRRYIKAITRVNDGMVILIDAEKIFSKDEIATLEKAR